MFFEYEKEENLLLGKRALTEYSLVSDGRLEISPSVWNEIVATHTKEEIRAHLSSISEGLPFPYRRYTDSVVMSDWLALLDEEVPPTERSWASDRIQGLSDLTYKGKPIFLQGSNRGLKVSDQYTQTMRMECGHERYKAPIHQWTREPFTDKTRYLFNPLFSVMAGVCAERGLGEAELYNCFRMHGYIASQFKPSCAKAIYDFFGAKKVLDFSMGWGDRLVGFHASSAESYIGIDPNTKLHEPYAQITDYCATGKRARYICAPAEEVDYSQIECDFVFTSPPYFDTERYSEEETQSWKRYGDGEAWISGFLYPTLRGCWSALSEGGRIAVNISDVFSTRVDGQYKKVCVPLLSYMESLGATYEGVIGYRLSKLPSTKIKQEADELAEPIFIWSKGVAPEPRWKSDNFFGV